MELRIFQKGFNYSQDGPGNRLVYHLQGCNLRCPWCANPEGLSVEGGERYPVEALVQEVLRSRAMFFDGGGVTLTGGEVTLQFDALKELLTRLHAEGVSACIETNGCSPRLPELFGLLDTLIMDVKHYDPEIHRAVTGASCAQTFQNIRAALEAGQKLALRANRREAALLLLSGMAMGVNWILLFEAYRYTTVSVATLSYYFAPVLVTAACPLLFHERLTGKQIVCFVMSTLGLVLVIGVGGLRGGADVRGVLFGLGAAAFYAAVILLNKFIRSVAGIQRTFLQFLAAIVILIPYVAATGGVSLGTLGARGWVCLLIVGFFHTGVTYCLYFSALRELPGQEVALLSYMDPLVAVIVSVTVLGEPVTAPQLVGGALILGFTLWNELPEKK